MANCPHLHGERIVDYGLELMAFDEAATVAAHVDRVMDCISREPDNIVDAMTALVHLRLMGELGVAYAKQRLEDEEQVGAYERESLQRTLASNRDLTAVASDTAIWAAKTRSLSAHEIWARFESGLRETAVRARHDIAECLLEMRRRETSFSGLPPTIRWSALVSIAGPSPAGVARAKAPEFDMQVTRAFDDPHVAADCAADGPMAGAKRVLAVYLGASVETIRRRIRDFALSDTQPCRTLPKIDP